MAPSRDIDSGHGKTGYCVEVDEEKAQGKAKKVAKRPLRPLSKKKVESYNEGLKKRGVVYLSRVPPFMKPAKVKHLMEQHGVVTRVRARHSEPLHKSEGRPLQ